MIRAHETLLKGLDSVEQQVRDDHSGDLANWLGYVDAWAACVHHHHSIEEKVLFPLLERKGLGVHTELEQHEKLHADLEALSARTTKGRADRSEYSADQLASLLAELAPNFRQHLEEEVAHLTCERLSPQVSSDELKACIAQLEAEAKKGDPFVAPVFMMSHTPPAHKYWSNMGWLMYRVLIPALSYRHAGYWKYSPEPLNL